MSSSYPIGWPFKDKDPTAWGNKVHYLLAEIDTVEDVAAKIHTLEQENFPKVIEQIIVKNG